MPTERKLNAKEITAILNWGKRWKAMKTRKWMARKYGVSERTIRRIVSNSGYLKRKASVDIAELAKRCDSFQAVPRETSIEIGEGR